MISRMNKTTSNANPPPKSPCEPDMKYPPFAKRETSISGVFRRTGRASADVATGRRVFSLPHPPLSYCTYRGFTGCLSPTYPFCLLSKLEGDITAC